VKGMVKSNNILIQKRDTHLIPIRGRLDEI